MQLSDLAEDAIRLDATAFAAKHPGPVLLGRESPEKVKMMEMETATLKRRPSGMHPLEQVLGLTASLDLRVFPLARRAQSFVEDRITVGRTAATDLWLEYDRVSKYHAFFTRSAEGIWKFITDASSANGTFVNTRRLPPNTPTELHDRMIIGFADYAFRFHLPEGLWATLRELSVD